MERILVSTKRAVAQLFIQKNKMGHSYLRTTDIDLNAFRIKKNEVRKSAMGEVSEQCFSCMAVLISHFAKDNNDICFISTWLIYQTTTHCYKTLI